MRLERNYKQWITLVLVGAAWLGGSATARAQAAKEEPAPFRGLPARTGLGTLSIERRVDDLLKQMTVEEKVGQLAMYSIGAPTGPGTNRIGSDEMIAKGQVGALFNLDNVQAANQFQHMAVEKSRLHIPLLFGLDVVHGYRTTFPVPLAMASTWDPPVVEQAAHVAAHEASDDGVRWTFSPMVDIARDARWGRMIEGAGEDPFLGSEIARAYVRGYQGKNLDAPDSVASTAKHYVGYGAAEGGRDYNSAEISEHTLREIYLPPFYAAIDEGGASIMSAFNPLNSVPASANYFTLTQVLRKEWQFQGITVSDWTSLGELVAHGIANDEETAARKAFLAGVDIDMQSNVYHQYLEGLVKSGRVPENQLDEAVRRVLRVKFALGLFDQPYTDEARVNKGPLGRDTLELSRTAAERSFVLLKNENNKAGQPLLPLNKTQKVALIGPLGDDPANMLGSWAGRGRPADAVTLKNALTTQVGADHLTVSKGGTITAATDKEIEDAAAAAKGADVVIMALGEDAPEMTAEAASRAHLELPGRQEELLEKVVATGTPVVLVLFSGRPLTLPWAFEHVPAVMAAWFPGVAAGTALTRTLYGEVSPSGRLVVSWPRTVGQLPLYYNALNTGRPAGTADLTHPPKAGEEKFLSRYVDEQNTPQFPFGYGLSYATIEYEGPVTMVTRMSAKAMNDNLRTRNFDDKTAVVVAVNVSNTGKVPTDETVQLYIGLRGTSMAEPVKSLKAFQRVSLAPGDTKRVTFQLGPEAFALWGDRNEWGVEPSKATIWVGPDSVRGGSVSVEIEE